MLHVNHLERYAEMCAELEAEAPQPRSKLLYPRPGESTKDNKCPHCDKDLKGKIHDLHTCLRETLAAKHWAAYSVLVGTGTVCPGATCKGVHATAAAFAEHIGAHHADVWNRDGHSCTIAQDGQQCGATFSSRAHAISHLEEAHGFVAKKTYVKVTLEYTFHCDLDHRWIFGRKRCADHARAHELARTVLPFGGATIPRGKDPSFHVLCPFCFGDEGLTTVERWKGWPCKRHGAHVADEHVRSLDPGSKTKCPVAECPATKLFSQVQLANHLVDDHDVHLLKNQSQSTKTIVAKHDLSNLLSRKSGSSASSTSKAPSSSRSRSTVSYASSGPQTTSASASTSTSASASRCHDPARQRPILPPPVPVLSRGRYVDPGRLTLEVVAAQAARCSRR
ncbi:hypothetical protein A1Q1_02227 [Trichosporon asahii var. asahii CBS 2479]|uniref:Uncharacterized protein n=1 Tax=Trichosporon asahii var. asahii (strain ATCC 90039 / CBS 2479 / JCM 2466 / KCTC 7840 / NBRC 103889/ NCYC 2677 / UAMH 7654) TaxID=1186058 RepID=J5T240_TRIAS|nr:hypothetical protein A1Q1_02227 [Trichosporon asahii var. asahii CBS 2479]EJT48761.1 hypothetical protein A1Q1_02227 [Trichosporon asahii var. asahii CBS 2479]